MDFWKSPSGIIRRHLEIRAVRHPRAAVRRGKELFRDDFCSLPHEPETPGMKVPKRLLRQGELLRREIRRGDFSPVHAY